MNDVLEESIFEAMRRVVSKEFEERDELTMKFFRAELDGAPPEEKERYKEEFLIRLHEKVAGAFLPEEQAEVREYMMDERMKEKISEMEKKLLLACSILFEILQMVDEGKISMEEVVQRLEAELNDLKNR